MFILIILTHKSNLIVVFPDQIRSQEHEANEIRGSHLPFVFPSGMDELGELLVREATHEFWKDRLIDAYTNFSRKIFDELCTWSISEIANT